MNLFQYFKMNFVRSIGELKIDSTSVVNGIIVCKLRTELCIFCLYLAGVKSQHLLWVLVKSAHLYTGLFIYLSTRPTKYLVTQPFESFLNQVDKMRQVGGTGNVNGVQIFPYNSKGIAMLSGGRQVIKNGQIWSTYFVNDPFGVLCMEGLQSKSKDLYVVSGSRRFQSRLFIPSGKKKYLTSYWFVTQGTLKGSECQ